MRQSAKINTIVFFSIAVIAILGLVFYFTQKPKISQISCVSLDSLEKDRCFLMQAATTDDISFCNYIEQDVVSSVCLNKMWAYPDCTYQQTLGNTTCVNQFISTAASSAKNITLCQEIEDSSIFFQCKESVIASAITQKDISFCNNDAHCLVVVFFGINDEVFCNTLDEKNKNDCLLAISSDADVIAHFKSIVPFTTTNSEISYALASSSLRDSFCNQVNDAELVNSRTNIPVEVKSGKISGKDFCFIANSFSRHLNLCSSIVDDDLKSLCMSEFDSSFNCEKITDEGQRNLCNSLEDKSRFTNVCSSFSNSEYLFNLCMRVRS